MIRYSLYAGYTHASCKKMRACAIEVLARTLQEKETHPCTNAVEAQLLREIIEKLGNADDISKINSTAA